MKEIDIVEETIRVLKEELAKALEENKKLKERKSKKLTAYGTLLKDSCGQGNLCGHQGMGCKNPDCPMM